MKLKSWREALLPTWEYYQDNPVGGALHIVLDDANVEDDSLRYCIGFAKERGDERGVALAELLLRMSVTQRRKLHAHYHLYADGAPRPS